MQENIGRYILKERIGAGGQAAVWLAEDPDLGRDVAVKIMHQVVSEGSNYLAALREEARLAASLSHPNIATVHDIQVQGGFASIIMEYFPESLDKRLANIGKLPSSEVVEIASHVCDALQYSHGRGIVHRDIKPHNILLDEDGIPKVTDFGLARATGLSEAATAVGTHFYMSPEQWRAEEAHFFPKVMRRKRNIDSVTCD